MKKRTLLSTMLLSSIITFGSNVFAGCSSCRRRRRKTYRPVPTATAHSMTQKSTAAKETTATKKSTAAKQSTTVEKETVTVKDLQNAYKQEKYYEEEKLAKKLINQITIKQIEDHFFSNKKNKLISKLICSFKTGKIADIRKHVYKKFATSYSVSPNGYNIFKIDVKLQGIDTDGNKSRELLYARKVEYKRRSNNKTMTINWKFKHNASLEQTLLCLAIHNKWKRENKPVAIAQHNYAYKVFCSFDDVLKDNLCLIGWIKLPFLKNSSITLFRYSIKLFRYWKGFTRFVHNKIVSPVLDIGVPIAAVVLPYQLSKKGVDALFAGKK